MPLRLFAQQHDTLGLSPGYGALTPRLPAAQHISDCIYTPGYNSSQEFLKNVKREYGKLITVLQAYALISTKVQQASSIFVCAALCHVMRGDQRRVCYGDVCE